jgi:tRNA-dihydrouridine synthase A
MTSSPPLSIAPMMERTDRHYRVMMRQLSRRTLLYTEMVVANAILNGDREHLLGFDPAEGPISLQLGGDNPADLAVCARIAEDLGYDEVNLNVGCPSDRVQSGRFGVCLMARPEVVADCVAAMRAACALPVTVKHRIGFDEIDGYDDMLAFVDTVAAAGCARFSVHARKAWLQGLSPKENREIPPLRPAEVWRLKAERPQLQIEINGGITTLDDAAAHLQHVDAVMIGRAAWDRPLLFSRADSRFFGAADPAPSLRALCAAMGEHAERWAAARPRNRRAHALKPLLNLPTGLPGARRFRQVLTTEGLIEGARPDALPRALAALEAAGADIDVPVTQFAV